MLSGADQFEQEYVRPKPGLTAIIGSKIYNDAKPDRRKLYPNAVGIDMFEGDGVDRVLDLTKRLPDDLWDAFDHVECFSTLEHCERPWLMAANIERMMIVGGTIHVTVPFAWRRHAYPNDFWRMSPAALDILFPKTEWSYKGLATNQELFPADLKRLPSIKTAGAVEPHIYLERLETCGFGQRT